MPLFAVDPHVASAARAVASAPSGIGVSDFAAAEFASVIARKVRVGDLDEAEARQAFSTFDNWIAAKAAPLTLLPSAVAAASSFLRRLDMTLRAPDAMHLAIVQRARASLLTFDARMIAAAQRLGIPVSRP